VLRGGISVAALRPLAVPFGPRAAANALATGIGIAPGISQDVKRKTIRISIVEFSRH